MKYKLYFQPVEGGPGSLQWFKDMESDDFETVLRQAILYTDSSGIEDVKIVANIENFKYPININITPIW